MPQPTRDSNYDRALILAREYSRMWAGDGRLDQILSTIDFLVGRRDEDGKWVLPDPILRELRRDRSREQE